MKILIVEDEPKTSEYLRQGLTEAGFVVDLARNGLDGQHLAIGGNYDLIILDVMLPDIDGFRILKALRDAGKQMPVLFLTARDSVADRVRGLEAGADDYLVKPPRRLELVSRVHALWRRTAGAQAEPKVLEHPPYRLDFAERRAYLDGAPVELTPKEFEVAWVLFGHLGRLTSRGHLLEAVWGHGSEVTTRTVDSHVSRMRAKLDLRPERGFRLVSVYGYGYRLEPAGAP
jgi:two-component system copper resistance phosphate regulon response regulator CusR